MKSLSKNEIWVKFAAACYDSNSNSCATFVKKAENAGAKADALLQEYLKRFPEEKEKTLLFPLLKEGI